jgi:hypothetical protein
VARVLIVGGGCRGRLLAGGLRERGHAVRVTTRTEGGRAEIEAAGAECWIGTPARLGTLTGALESVTVMCWLLGCASGDGEEVADLHGSRLRAFLSRTIDTTVRGVVYEAGGTVAESVLAAGVGIAQGVAERNAIPLEILRADPGEVESWLGEARAAVGSLLGGVLVSRVIH